ncbi:hypothetical protein ABVC46_01675 [Lactobacillus crispatus]|uniref:hypothetical protein n=1 Tax=Lactobacillus crispatus TaxID=47770 RepID=UPI003369EA36
MPIRQFVLEPPISIDWNHRPISSQLKLDKTSKLLILNDSSIDDLAQSADQKHIKVVFCDQSHKPELLLTPEVIGDNRKLNTLVDTYFSLNLSHNVKFSRGSLTLLLRIMFCASDKSYQGILDILKKWFEAPKDKLSNLIAKVKVDKKLALPKIDKAILTFAKATDYTEGILNFLWKLHGANAWNKNKDKEVNSLNTPGQITVMPASIFKEDTYYYALFVYGVKSHIEVYIDSDVPFTLIQPYLREKADTFSIARYANSDPSELAFIASKAENMLSSTQIPDQTLFFAWLAYKDAAALVDYSLNDINRLLSESPYVTYVGMYLTLIKSHFCLTQYNISKYRWMSQKFDLKYIMSKTIDKNKAKASPNTKKLEAKSAVQTSASDNTELVNSAADKVISELKQSTSQLSKTLTMLSIKVDLIDKSATKNKNIAEKDEKADQANSELKEMQDKLTHVEHAIDSLPDTISDLIKQNLSDVSDTAKESAPWGDADDPAQLEKDYDKAIHDQGNNFTDFDD